jgi:hypothetical protein
MVNMAATFLSILHKQIWNLPFHTEHLKLITEIKQIYMNGSENWEFSAHFWKGFIQWHSLKLHKKHPYSDQHINTEVA